MFGPFKKNKPGAPKIENGQAVDFGQVKTGGVATPTSNNIVSDSVMKSGNISSMGLTKEDQAALVAERNAIPVYTKALKYASTVLFSLMLGGFLFLTADLDPTNTYFGLVGLNENTGSAYSRISQENTQKKQELQKIDNQISKLRDRISNQIFGNFVEQTKEIEAGQKNWFTKVKNVTRFDEELGEEVAEKKVVFGYIDMVNSLIGYFQDRSFKTSFFKAKEEGLVTASGSRSRGRISSSEALLMSNELGLKSLAINDNTANINLDASDIYGKVFTLGGEIVDITNSTPIFKNGSLRTFQRTNLDSGDAGMNIALRLDLQALDDEDPADEKFKYLRTWMEDEKIIPASN